ncbi:Aspartyl protease UND [Bienertia sinuspersici]
MQLHSSISKALVMVVGIGTNDTSTPVLRTELLIDTGSSFTWLQAYPCNLCYDQGDFPYYNRTSSLSFDLVNCEDETCKLAPNEAHPGCDSITWSPSVACSYNVGYLDGSNSSGVMGRETFYIPDVSLRRYRVLQFVPFGLGTSNHLPNNFRSFAPGIAGFGMYGYGTFLSTFGVNKFSHCFPREDNDNGVLSLGEPIVLEDDGTLPVQMLFDTGSSESILSSQLLDAVETGIKYALKKFRAKRSPSKQLCYKITDMLKINLDMVAKVTFEFRYTTRIDVFSFHAWEQKQFDYRNWFCLRFIRGSEGTNVFGNNLMRDVNIGYTLYEDDLAMYFNHQPCWR